MPCRCDSNACTSCACAKSNTLCTAECHGGQSMDNVPCMNTEVGKKVKLMKIKDVRTALIANNLSIVGDRGELYKRLADQLRKQAPTPNSGVEAPSSSAATKSSQDDAKNELFKFILNNEDNYSFILSLSGKTVQANSSKPDLRRAYLLLSAKVHPDKNPGNQEAVKAFQTLLSAYERLANPEKFEEDDDEKPAKKRQKTERFTRSNGGCFKTKIKCPQCKEEWGLPVVGLEDCAYNFMMMGLKQYICHICSCQFGCMTALHFCPHCRKEFAYDPDDYHRKIACGNVKCSKEFGFWMFKVSERREREIRQEAKELHEQRLKRAAQKKRRAQRAGNRGAEEELANKEHLQEQLFVLQLRDTCPRCGRQVERGEGQDEAQQHLRECNDQEKIKLYKAQVAEVESELANKAHSKESEEELLALKQWEMNGRQLGQLWMLSDAMLKRQCEGFNLPTKGKRHEMIQRLSEYIRSQERLMITDGKTKIGGGESGYDTCSLKHADENDLPQNLNAMDKEELQDLCASYNVKFNAKKDIKRDLIKKFEQARYKGTDQQLMLGYNDEKKKSKSGKNKDEDCDYKPEL